MEVRDAPGPAPAVEELRLFLVSAQRRNGYRTEFLVPPVGRIGCKRS
jgi:hypothetical protein